MKARYCPWVGVKPGLCQADRTREPIARDRAPTPGRQRSQALAPEDVVHPAGRRRLRRPHGGRARSLCRGAGPAAAGGLLRREPDPAHRRGAPTDPARARKDRALRLRIPAQRHRQPVRLPRCEPPLAQGQGHRAPHGGRCMRELTDLHYPKAERIRVVLDNLSTHSAAALYQTFSADDARRLLRRLEFHYVPKHASWLNMVEIEIGVLASQCLDRRIDSYAHLLAETAAWEKRRNAECARINWMFTTEKARAKMGRAYPKPACASG